MRDVIKDFTNRATLPFKYSRVSFIGGGGSGKTSMGMIFQNDPLAVDARVESTIGFEVSTCEIHATATVADTASVSGGKGGFRRASQADGLSQSAKAVARSITQCGANKDPARSNSNGNSNTNSNITNLKKYGKAI